MIDVNLETTLKRERWLREELEFMFPEMFRDESGKQTAFDISVGQGWNELVLDLCQDIAAWCKESKIPTPKVVQIKEKFGELRFYCDGTDEMTDQFIMAAMEKSAETCERCGAPGYIRGNGWLRCECDECMKRGATGKGGNDD